MSNQINLLDRLAIASFFIGLANYTENVDQTTLQNDLSAVVNELHEHLSKQDIKLQQIEDKLRRLLDE